MKIKNIGLFNILSHWNEYYNSNNSIKEASKFAKFCIRYINKNKPLLDIGCGNGRDSIYFSKKGIVTVGVDQSDIISKLEEFPRLTYFRSTFDKLITHINWEADYLYMRFVIHSITKEEATRLFRWASAILRKHGKLFIESRSVNDEFYGQGTNVGKDSFVNGHYRRFIRRDELKEELESYGLKTIYIKEGKGFAPFKGEDPSIIRLIVEK